MTTNILMNLVKADMGSKQKEYSPKYTSKDTSDSFMKVFEVANKSYNFDSEKMDGFSPDKWDENQYNKDFNQKDYGYEQDNHDKKWKRQEDKDFYEEPLSYLQEQRPVEEPVNKTSEIKREVPTEPVKHETSESVQEKTGLKHDEVKITEKTVKLEDTASQSKESAPVEGQQVKGKDAEKQLTEKPAQKQAASELAKDTASKLLLEKEAAKTSQKTAKKADTKASQQVNAEKQEVKELPQKNTEKQVENPQQKADKTQSESSKKEVLTQQQHQKNIGTTQEAKKVPEVKADDAKIKVAEKNSDEKIDFNQQTENKAEKAKAAKKTNASIPFAKQLEIKEELKVENIKITAEAEAQKTLKTPMDMNKQGQQNFGQQVRANAMHTGLGEGGVHNLDIQKTSSFSKVMNAKQTESTQNSVINQVKEASAKLSSGKSEVTITLRPESLGKVNINIVSNKGEVTAQITAENNQTKEMLLKGAESLRQSLVDQGINANKITVNVQNASDNETEFEQANQDASFSETNSGSDGQENLAGNDSAPGDFESYEFEEETEDENKNLTGKVDYKV